MSAAVTARQRRRCRDPLVTRDLHLRTRSIGAYSYANLPINRGCVQIYIFVSECHLVVICEYAGH